MYGGGQIEPHISTLPVCRLTTAGLIQRQQRRHCLRWPARRLIMNGQQTTGNAGAGVDVSAEEARLKEAMKQLKLLHVKVSRS